MLFKMPFGETLLLHRESLSVQVECFNPNIYMMATSLVFSVSDTNSDIFIFINVIPLVIHQMYHGHTFILRVYSVFLKRELALQKWVEIFLVCTPVFRAIKISTSKSIAISNYTHVMVHSNMVNYWAEFIIRMSTLF